MLEVEKIKEAQDLLLRHFLIMNSGVYYFNKPCNHCKNYFEAGDFANRYIKIHNTKYIGKTGENIDYCRQSWSGFKRT